MREGRRKEKREKGREGRFHKPDHRIKVLCSTGQGGKVLVFDATV